MRWPAPGLVLLLLAGAPAAADERVPLGDNFGPGELVATGAFVLIDGVLVLGADRLAEWRGDPLIGGPPELDRRISDALFRGPGAGPMLWDIPEKAGQIVVPVATVGYYLLDAAALRLSGGALTGDVNADHELLALAEGYSLATAVNQLTKLGVGRLRPEYALAGREPTRDDPTLSFFSMHTTSAFFAASFVWRDASDWLVHERLAERSDAARLWLGRVVPGVVLYGTATLIGVSRIVDQEHYFTDVLVGAAVGTLVGHGAYALHFDLAGRPRRRAGALRIEPTAFPGGIGLLATF